MLNEMPKIEDEVIWCVHDPNYPPARVKVIDIEEAVGISFTISIIVESDDNQWETGLNDLYSISDWINLFGKTDAMIKEEDYLEPPEWMKPF